MIKALIIDDEESVREAIKILGDWEELGIEDVLEAQNGKEGIRLLCEEKPDIVLLDMRMPQMNGVEFLKATERDFPQTISIVVSGYDDFEFTRQAIKSKVFDYLLKPVNREQLNSALRKAVESIRERREKQEELIDKSMKMNVSLRMLKEKIYMSAVEGNLNVGINAGYLKLIGITGKEHCMAAVMRFLNINGVCDGSFGGDMDTLFFGILNITDEICGGYFRHFCCKNAKSGNEILVIAIDGSENAGEMKPLVEDILARVARKLKETLGVIAAFGIGSFNAGIESLAVSFREASAALNDVNLLSLRHSAAINAGKTPDQKGFSILSKMPLVRSAIEGGSFEYLNGIINDFMDKIAQTGYVSLRDANKLINELVFMLNDILLEFDGFGAAAVRDAESELKDSGISFDYSDFQQLKQLLTSILRYYYDKIRSRIKSSREFDVGEIKDYIDRNYFQEIKINMFTEKYYLSKVYMMKLFKRRFGMGIYEYVQKVRMEKSKELLHDPNINIQNISRMVGYSNNNYFSKAFKNYYGISPSAYRMMVFRNADVPDRQASSGKSIL